jgi:hypothetical protein
MVLIVRKGRLLLLFNDGATVTVALDPWDTYSIPAGVVRSIVALGDDPAEALIVLSGDHRKRPVFAAETLAAAQDAGLGLDAGGFVAKAALLPQYRRAG